METLIEVDKSKWPELRNLYLHDWPKNAVAFCVLDTNISYPDLCDIFNFKVYCPEGNLNNGMVGTSDVSISFKVLNIKYKYEISATTFKKISPFFIKLARKAIT